MAITQVAIVSILKQMSDLAKGKIPDLSTKRSPKWRKVRGLYLMDHPACAVCGETHNVEVHHKKPFHLHPELELDPNNFITLCETASHGIVCHLLIGHLGNYKDVNPDVEADALAWFNKLNKPC